MLNFVIPAGATGATGADGATGANGTAATVQVGSTTTGAPGTNASVTNTGTESNAVLNFVIPAGATGATGANGAAGTAATVQIGTTTTEFLPAVQSLYTSLFSLITCFPHLEASHLDHLQLI